MNFTYRVKWSHLDISYYGVRYAEDATLDSLFTTYFTSSKYVHEFIEKNGNPDIIEIRQTFDTKLEAKQWEERVINKGKLYKSEKWLNKGNNGSFKNVVMSDEIKNSISKTKREKSLKRPKRIWIKRENDTMLIDATDSIPEGWVKGRIKTEAVLAHIDFLNKPDRLTEEQKKEKAQKHSEKTKGKKKPVGFGDKISKANTGKEKIWARGDANPAKRDDVREKISKSWENREPILWFYNPVTLEKMWVYKKDLHTVNTIIWKRGKLPTGKWFNDGVKNIWVKNDDISSSTNLYRGKVK